MKRLNMLRSLSKLMRNCSGETMVETLVSVLISSLALLLLATAIGASVNIVMSSKRSMQGFYSDESTLAQGGGSITNSQKVTPSVALREDEVGGNVKVKVLTSENDNLSLYERE